MPNAVGHAVYEVYAYIWFPSKSVFSGELQSSPSKPPKKNSVHPYRSMRRSLARQACIHSGRLGLIARLRRSNAGRCGCGRARGVTQQKENC